MADVEARVRRLVEAAQQFAGGTASTEEVVRTITEHLRALLSIPGRAKEAGRDSARSPRHAAALESAGQYLDDRTSRWAALLGWVFVRALGGLVTSEQAAAQSRTWFDEWLLGRTLHQACLALGMDDAEAALATSLARVLISHERALWAAEPRPARRALEALLRDGDVLDFLQVNRYREVLWFNKERFEDLMGGLLTAAVALIAAETGLAPPQASGELAARCQLAESIQEAGRESGYQVEKLVELVADRAAGKQLVI
jgi:hypothetical protein